LGSIGSGKWSGEKVEIRNQKSEIRKEDSQMGAGRDFT